MTTHSGMLAWKIPWSEEPKVLDMAEHTCTHLKKAAFSAERQKYKSQLYCTSYTEFESVN